MTYSALHFSTAICYLTVECSLCEKLLLVVRNSTVCNPAKIISQNGDFFFFVVVVARVGQAQKLIMITDKQL